MSPEDRVREGLKLDLKHACHMELFTILGMDGLLILTGWNEDRAQNVSQET